MKIAELNSPIKKWSFLAGDKIMVYHNTILTEILIETVKLVSGNPDFLSQICFITLY